MKKIFLYAAVCAALLCSCNNKPTKEVTPTNGKLEMPDDRHPEHEVPTAEQQAKARENAKTYGDAIKYLEEKHPGFEDWDASVVLDSIARFADPTYDRSTKPMGITWREMRAMKQGAPAGK